MPNKARRHGILILTSAVLLLLTASGCRQSFADITRTAAAANPPTPAGTPDPAFAADRGLTVFNGAGMCSTCHTLDGNDRPTGPGLGGIASGFASEAEAAAFLRQSIVDVKAAVTDGYRDDLMPANYADLLTPQQIDDLVAFLLTLD